LQTFAVDLQPVVLDGQPRRRDGEVDDAAPAVHDNRVLVGDLDAGARHDVGEEGLEQAVATLVAERTRLHHLAQRAEPSPPGPGQVVDQPPQGGHGEQAGVEPGEMDVNRPEVCKDVMASAGGRLGQEPAGPAA
jgi:hypothetical protein